MLVLYRRSRDLVIRRFLSFVQRNRDPPNGWCVYRIGEDGKKGHGSDPFRRFIGLPREQSSHLAVHELALRSSWNEITHIRDFRFLASCFPASFCSLSLFLSLPSFILLCFILTAKFERKKTPRDLLSLGGNRTSVFLGFARELEFSDGRWTFVINLRGRKFLYKFPNRNLYNYNYCVERCRWIKRQFVFFFF